MKSDAMDVVFIRDLRLQTVIGAYDFERHKPQTLQFDLEIGRARLAACDTGLLSDTVDYAGVVNRIQEIMDDHQYRLLEPLAERIAQAILKEFDVQHVRLEVTKTGIVPSARQVGVRIERWATP